ncbi:MAG: thiamine-binding protein [Bacteroidetes bacterium]|nr:thiamine-binding protein [Bacteroidota bacterium]
MIINVAIQLLPLQTDKNTLAVIDEAIALITESGLKHLVCPFETVVEGESDKVYQLIQKIQKEIILNHASEILINLKIHAAKNDLLFMDKLKNYLSKH